MYRNAHVLKYVIIKKIIKEFINPVMNMVTSKTPGGVKQPKVEILEKYPYTFYKGKSLISFLREIPL